MRITPIETPTLTSGDDIGALLETYGTIDDGDIVAISSKAIATVEGAAINLSSLSISDEARSLAERYAKSPAYYQAVLNETSRMNGSMIQAVNGIVLTELRPDGFEEGSILVPNAGLDESNIEDGFVIGWPVDPVASLRNIKKSLSKDIGLLITDSGLCPRRRGVLSFALAVCGFDPIVSMVDRPDIFQKNLQVTEEAVADQLAVGCNMLMGNADQKRPAAVVSDHEVERSNFCGWVSGIERELDIYHGVI